MARCSSSFTAQYSSDYTSSRPSNRCHAVTSSSVRREESKTRVFTTSSPSRYSNVAAERGAVSEPECVYGGQELDMAALAENCRMDNEVAKLRDVIRAVEHKFQNVQADLTNLGVELKKFRNMNKMYKRVLHRQHELNQRMRWRLFETDQENETLRQLVKTLRASREMEFGATRSFMPSAVNYTSSVVSPSKLTEGLKSPRHHVDVTTKSHHHSTTAKTSPSAGHAFADQGHGHVTGYKHASRRTPGQGQGHSSYFPRSSTRSTVERSTSGTQRDYAAGNSTSFDYESREVDYESRDNYGGNRSSKKSTYRTSSYTKFDLN